MGAGERRGGTIDVDADNRMMRAAKELVGDILKAGCDPRAGIGQGNLDTLKDSAVAQAIARVFLPVVA